MTEVVAVRALRRYRDRLDDDKEVNFDKKQTLNIRKFLESTPPRRRYGDTSGRNLIDDVNMSGSFLRSQAAVPSNSPVRAPFRYLTRTGSKFRQVSERGESRTIQGYDEFLHGRDESRPYGYPLMCLPPVRVQYNAPVICHT